MFTDLKKLMKYDFQKADKENLENINYPKKFSQESYYETPCTQVDYDCAKQYSPQYDTTCSDTNYRCAERPYVSQPVDVIFSNLHSASTVSSRARSAVQTPNIPGVSFAKPRKTARQEEPSESSRLTSYYTDCTDDSRSQSALSNQRSKCTAPNIYRPKSCKIIILY